jgi:nucleoside-diphosphate-sugar epimerase
VRLIVDSPLHAIETNVHGTEAVLAHAAKKKRPVFIASTSEVYGKSQAVPFRESGDLVMGPTHLGRWSYACSKALDEFLALAYYADRGLPVIIGRLFNTVGPRQIGRYGMVVPTFARQAVLNAPITVFGDGRQKRCFCHVKDVVRAIADLMERGDLYGEVFNIGSEEEVTIRQLAESRPRSCRLAFGGRDHPLRGGLRRRVRGHVPACSRHLEGQAGDRMAAHARPRRDSRRRAREHAPRSGRRARTPGRPAGPAAEGRGGQRGAEGRAA